ncbi:MAG: hypothetical protein ACEY3D_08560 [Rickettsia sp.]|uniref:hypothetical protein n=1 Tax=Rickettsia sp. TaxID=789 RepID=UPI00397C29F6
MQQRRLDHRIQLKILKLLVFFIVFMDLVSKPRGDSGFYPPTQQCLLARRCCVDR